MQVTERGRSGEWERRTRESAVRGRSLVRLQLLSVGDFDLARVNRVSHPADKVEEEDPTECSLTQPVVHEGPERDAYGEHAQRAHHLNRRRDRVRPAHRDVLVPSPREIRVAQPSTIVSNMGRGFPRFNDLTENSGQCGTLRSFTPGMTKCAKPL